MNLDGCICLAQAYLQNNPLIVLGSGASASYGLPTMGMLSEEICKNYTSFDDDGFDNFYELLKKGHNLEAAIDASTLKTETLDLIRKIVWNYINNCDLNLFDNGVFNTENALTKLFLKVIQPTPNKVTVVTTNYDRLPEYAADIINASTNTGFEGSLIRKLEIPTQNATIKRIRARERSVDIWKVHGSLDWFLNSNDKIISYPLSTKVPFSCTPMIIPPGKDKYSKTHNEPYRTIITQADAAFIKAGSYLCVGYGFNDEHIQPKLINEIQKNKAIVVLARNMTESCKRLIIDAGISKYMIFERHNDGKTSVYTNSWQEIFEGEYWNLEEFMKIW